MATQETSLYDEWGQRRRDFGLRDLFGCSFTGQIDERMQNSYLTIERELKQNPFRAGLDGTPRVINGVRQVQVRALDATYKAPLTLIPSYPDLPMERVIVTVQDHGNTSTASVPLALDVGVRDGRIKRGDMLLLEAFGGGFTWGAALIRY